MKTLFIVVSIIALSYLALQTSFVKSYMVSFTQTNDLNLASNQLENNTNKAFMTKINALEMQSARDREMYTQRISELEQNLTALKQTLNDNERRKTDESLLLTLSHGENNEIQNTTEPAGNEENTGSRPQNLQEKASLINRPNVKQASAEVPKAQISQQQKRLQQQAMLRSLSQKMELAALNSLTH